LTDQLYKTYLSLRGTLLRAVSGIVPPKEVEDIVQEAYVKACQAGNLTRIDSPRSYLLKTARNLALDHAKSAESRLTDSFEEDLATNINRRQDGTYEDAATNEEFALFCEAVRQLPQQCRRAFILKKVYGYSRREIAEVMGLSENTVQTQIARGMKRCTFFMEQFDEKVPKGSQFSTAPSTAKQECEE